MKTMNREIKFRCWLPSQKRVMEIGIVKNDTAVWICETGFDVVDHFTGKPTSMGSNEDGVVLMQFTGLTDKNGKEIYEGDIVKIKNWSVLFKVIWDEYYAKFTVEKICCDLGAKMDYIPQMESEIIGNIYENPELLNN